MARTSRKCGCSCPVFRRNSIRIRNPRRARGSASANRPVSRSSAARLLRRVATSGWSEAVAALVDGQRPAHQWLGLGQAAGGLQQQRQVVERRGDVWVVGAVAMLADGQRPAIQRLGLAQPVGGLQQRRQVVEGGGDVGVVGSVAMLVDGQRPAIQRLGLAQPVGGLQQRRQVVEGGGDVGVVGAVAILVDGQGAAIQRLGLAPAGWWPAAVTPGC